MQTVALPSSTDLALRERQPPVQCIINDVCITIAANVLNAPGASPALVHDEASTLSPAASIGWVEHR